MSVEALICIHGELLAQHGGSEGLRDRGLLESAVARPQQRYAYGDADPFQLAAALFEAVAKNHPFVDGNKRAAFTAGYTFLALNGQELNASEVDAVVTTLQVAASGITREALAAWLRASCIPSTLSRPPVGKPASRRRAAPTKRPRRRRRS